MDWLDTWTPAVSYDTRAALWRIDPRDGYRPPSSGRSLRATGFAAMDAMERADCGPIGD